MPCPEGYVEAVATPRSTTSAARFFGGVAPAAVPACVRPSDPGDGLLGAITSGIVDLFPLVFPLVSLPIIQPKPFVQELAELGIEDFAGAPQGTVSTTVSVGTTLLSSGIVEGGPMGLIDDVFTGGGVEDFFSGLNFGQLGQSLVTEVGLPLLRQELVGQPQAISVSAPGAIMPSIRGAVGSIAGGLGMGVVGTGLALTIKEAVKAILQKIAINKNLKNVPSLSTVMSWVRKMLPIIGQAALAGSLAITAEELAQLVMANATRKHRRMNPANVKALRRSMRRLDSFHRICQKSDMLRSRGRRKSSGRGCGGDRVIVAK